MKKYIFLTLTFVLVLFLCSCSPKELRTISLGDPSPYTAATYKEQPSVNKLIEYSTHIAVVKLEDVQPHWTQPNQSIYSFSVLSFLAGEKYSDTIQVINNLGFYEFDETYLLFLYCWSSSLQPFDYYIPFNKYTFRISEEGDIDCLQSLANIEAGTPRTYVKPFENPEYNNLSFLEGFIKKHAGSVKKISLASEDKDLNNLISRSELIMEIEPTIIEPTGSFVSNVWFEVTNCFQGNPPTDNWLMLPFSVELNKKYIVLLYEEEPGFFRLVSRNSLYVQGSQEYEEFLSVWVKR